MKYLMELSTADGSAVRDVYDAQDLTPSAVLRKVLRDYCDVSPPAASLATAAGTPVSLTFCGRAADPDGAPEPITTARPPIDSLTPNGDWFDALPVVLDAGFRGLDAEFAEVLAVQLAGPLVNAYRLELTGEPLVEIGLGLYSETDLLRKGAV